MTITVTINGTRKTLASEPGERLFDLLRREGYMGVKTGCGTGDCGACAVLLNGRAVNSCIVFAAKADGGEVTTVEGLERDGRLHPVQEAFLDEGGIQCGYCTPGMVIGAVDLLSRNPEPTEEEIRRQCLDIRRGWSPGVREQRLAEPVHHAEIRNADFAPIPQPDECVEWWEM